MDAHFFVLLLLESLCILLTIEVRDCSVKQSGIFCSHLMAVKMESSSAFTVYVQLGGANCFARWI